MSGSNETSRAVNGRRRLQRAACVITALPALAGAPGAHAFGLEQLTVAAAHIVAADALKAVAATAGRAAPRSVAAQPQGLVSQDRSTLDLSRLSMSAFGDTDETAAR